MLFINVRISNYFFIKSSLFIFSFENRVVRGLGPQICGLNFGGTVHVKCPELMVLISIDQCRKKLKLWVTKVGNISASKIPWGGKEEMRGVPE